MTEVTVSESGPEITVEFPLIGPKRLHLQYAPVTKLKDLNSGPVIAKNVVSSRVAGEPVRLLRFAAMIEAAS